MRLMISRLLLELVSSIQILKMEASLINAYALVNSFLFIIFIHQYSTINY